MSTSWRRLNDVLQRMVRPGSRVLELGCRSGERLATLQTSRGVGVERSVDLIALARRTQPHLTFHEWDAQVLSRLQGPFDVIILSEPFHDQWHQPGFLHSVVALCTPRTRVFILGARPHRSDADIRRLSGQAGLDVVTTWHEVLLPFTVPVLTRLCNTVLVRVWPFTWLARASVTLLRPQPTGAVASTRPTVSVIVPARNEAGNVSGVVSRTPEMGAGTELVFVEGHSTDGTYDAIARAIAGAPERRCRLLRQPGVGKGDAVRWGFAHATGDILMILDADLTVPPEDLPGFYMALTSGTGELINGVRLVYPLERGAMRPANRLANVLFSWWLSWLIGQRIQDALCGTKVLWACDYQQIAECRAEHGDLDPFGDFDLLFGAARRGMKILDLPIHYGARTYGQTQIQRWRHGVLLLRMSIHAGRRIKFV